jgi:hypothetical protein
MYSLNRNESKTIFQKVCDTKTDTAALKRNLANNSKSAADPQTVKKTKFQERMEKLAPTEEVGIEAHSCFAKIDIVPELLLITNMIFFHSCPRVLVHHEHDFLS